MPKKRSTKSAKRESDRIFSLIVRSVGYCENCGSTETLQCAHWISRRYAHTRTDFDNAFSLCARCHRWFTDHPTEWGRWTVEQRGEATYQRILEASHKRTKFDWHAELDRLREMARREDVTV